MSAVAKSELSTMPFAPVVSEVRPQPSPPSWETLCGWLTRDLRGMMTTIERREKDGDWVMESLSFPMESVTTHMTSNGVRVILNLFWHVPVWTEHHSRDAICENWGLVLKGIGQVMRIVLAYSRVDLVMAGGFVDAFARVHLRWHHRLEFFDSHFLDRA